nr:MAG TPA: DIM protein [Caudoviricetes sp.]
MVNCWCGIHGDCDDCPVRDDREGYGICQSTGFEDLDVADLKVVARLFFFERRQALIVYREVRY